MWTQFFGSPCAIHNFVILNISEVMAKNKKKVQQL